MKQSTQKAIEQILIELAFGDLTIGNLFYELHIFRGMTPCKYCGGCHQSGHHPDCLRERARRALNEMTNSSELTQPN